MTSQEWLGMLALVVVLSLLFLLLLRFHQALLLYTIEEMRKDGLSEEEIAEALRKTLIQQGYMDNF